MATVAELLVRIGGDSSGLRREINNSQRQLRRAFGPDALALSEDTVGALGAMALAIGAVGIAAVKMSSDFAASKTAFTTLLGSTDKAEKMLNDLAVFAADTPFELPGLIKASQRLMAFQFAAADIIPIMSAVGNAVSLVGGGQEAIDGIVRALGQIQAKGKLSAEEMNQLSERGINGWKYIADAMGVSVAEVMELSEKGAVDATTAINAVVMGMQKNFAGGMDAMSKTVPGLLSTIKDNVGMVLKEIGDKITTGLNLQGMLQSVADYLGVFSNAVKSAGVKEAIMGLVPPEAIAAVFALSGAIIAVAIPAMYAFGLSVWGAMAPMIPFIAAGVAVGLLAYEIWRNWEPLSGLFSALWDAVYSTFVSAWDLIISVYTGYWGGMYDTVTGFLSAIVDVIFGGWDNVAAGTSTTWDFITNVIGSAWDRICMVVKTGADYIVKALNFIGVNTTNLENFISTATSGIAKVQSAAAAVDLSKLTLGTSAKDISSLVGLATPKPNTTFTGLHGNGASELASKDGKDGKGKSNSEANQVVKAEADYAIDVEKNKTKLLLALIKDEEAELDRQRKNGLAGIREYWSKRQAEDSVGLATIQQYWDKRTALETSGVQAEIDALNAEKSALENQMTATADPSDSIGLKKKMLDLTTNLTLKERELGEVVKKNSALAAAESVGYIAKYAELLKNTQEAMKNMNTTNVTNGLNGSAKDIAGFDKEKADSIKAVQDIVDSWQKGTAEIKDQYGVVITDKIEMTKWAALQIEIINKNSLDKQNQYYSAAKDVQANIDAAYKENSMAKLQEALTEQNAIRLNDYTAQQSMMQTYQAAFLAAHSTTAQLMSDLYAGAFGGLSDNISEVLQGTKSINEAFSALGKTMLKVVADYIAKWLAGKVMMAIFGKTTMATETAASVAAGAATAAAWAPAAAMVSLASFGANAAPAMAGIGATTAMSAGLSIPALAAGGVTTGASLALIGEGHYDEAVLPLNKKAFEKVGIGGNDQQQPLAVNQFSINAIDGKSFSRWLEDGGGAIIEKYSRGRARSFAPLGG